MTVKKIFVPETKVSTGSVQDLINQMRGESNIETSAGTNQNASDTTAKTDTALTTEPAKKGVVPKAIVSVDPEIQRMRELLSSGREAVIDSDGTISETGEDKQTSTTKAKTVPKAIVSAETDNRSVQSIIDEMRGVTGESGKNTNVSDSAERDNKAEENPKKKGLVPQAIVSM